MPSVDEFESDILSIGEELFRMQWPSASWNEVRPRDVAILEPSSIREEWSRQHDGAYRFERHPCRSVEPHGRHGNIMNPLYEEHGERIAPVGVKIVAQVAHVVPIVLIQAGPGTSKYPRFPGARPAREGVRSLLHSFLQDFVRHRLFCPLHRVERRPSRTPIKDP